MPYNGALKNNYSRGSFNIWKTFSVSIFFFLIPILLARVITPFYYSVVSLLLSIIIFGYIRLKNSKESREMECLLIPFVIGRTLFIYAIIIVFVNAFVLGTESFKIQLLASSKNLHPYYFPILILAPILTAVSWYVKYKKCAFCRLCVIRHGYPSERSILGRLQSQETKNIVSQFFVMGLVFSVISWVYFIFLYNTSSISHFDNMVFAGFPIIIAFIQEIIVTIRCITISIYNNRIFKNSIFKPNKSLLRFLLICDDKIYLTQADRMPKEWDTPLRIYKSFQKSFSMYEIRELLLKSFDIKSDEIRLIYRNIDTYINSGIWHFVCFIDDKSKIKKEGNWIDTEEFIKLYKGRSLSSNLKKEFNRIITIITTVKTYNEDGSRRYAIKGYVPQFCISDIKEVKVSMSDSKWLMVSIQNEDNKFFKVKKLWYKYVEGLID